jgi:membrane protein
VTETATPTDLPPGATAGTPWSMPRSAWIQVVKRVYVMIGFHELGLLAAGLAFFVFLAITPLIAAIVMVYGLVGDPAAVQEQMQAIVNVVPVEAAKLIQEQLLQIVTTSSA